MCHISGSTVCIHKKRRGHWTRTKLGAVCLKQVVRSTLSGGPHHKIHEQNNPPNIRANPCCVVPGIRKPSYEVRRLTMLPEYRIQVNTAAVVVVVVVLLLLLAVLRCCSSKHRVWTQTSPGGLEGGPRAYHDQFRGFESHRVHTRSKGLFSCIKMESRKARERQIATFFDENR